jgi:hypothetical protein
VEQTDGAPLPQPADIGGDPGDRTASLKAAITSRDVVVEYADNLDGALGLSCGGRFRVLTGLPPASEFAVLTHEYAHLCGGVRYVTIVVDALERVGPK